MKRQTQDNASLSRTSTPDQPNLIYVFADQLGANHVGCGGSELAHTPNIDNLAKSGVNFTNAVSTAPVCAAHRASLLTGKYPTTTGMVINELRMNPNHECLGHVLTKAGYETGYVGKWHLWANQLGRHHNSRNSFVPPGPHRLGFDGYWAAYNFNHEYYDAYYHTDSPDKIGYGDGVYEPDGQTDLAISFIKDASHSEKPFALFLSWGTPHDPWKSSNVPKEFLAKFKNVSFPNPPNYQSRNDHYADLWGRFHSGQRKKLENWRRAYYAMTANLDWNLGRLLDAVDELGVAGRTIIAFSSDHGEMFGAHGRRAKNIFYDEAARVPFLIRWPARISSKLETDACLGTVDIMPTLLSLMRLPVPEAVDGMDLSHIPIEEKGPEPEAALMQNNGACAMWKNGYEWRAVRDKRYTYAIYRKDGRELLFDNHADPYQMNDLISDPDHKQIVERIRDILKRKLESLNDTFEESKYYRDNWTKDRVILRGAKG